MLFYCFRTGCETLKCFPSLTGGFAVEKSTPRFHISKASRSFLEWGIFHWQQTVGTNIILSVNTTRVSLNEGKLDLRVKLNRFDFFWKPFQMPICSFFFIHQTLADAIGILSLPNHKEIADQTHSNHRLYLAYPWSLE